MHSQKETCTLKKSINPWSQKINKYHVLGGKVKEMIVHILFNIDDNWMIKCMSKQDGEKFFGGDVFELIHENT